VQLALPLAVWPWRQIRVASFPAPDVYVGDDGKLWARGNPGPSAPLREAWHVEFYVDPRDGIIKRNKWHTSTRQHYAKKPLKAEELSIEIDAYTQLRRIDGRRPASSDSGAPDS
jgi:hypothetical protein